MTNLQCVYIIMLYVLASVILRVFQIHIFVVVKFYFVLFRFINIWYSAQKSFTVYMLQVKFDFRLSLI